MCLFPFRWRGGTGWLVSDCLSPLASEHTLSFGVMDIFILSVSCFGSLSFYLTELSLPGGN